jgi:hypothetical protein
MRQPVGPGVVFTGAITDCGVGIVAKEGAWFRTEGLRFQGNQIDVDNAGRWDSVEDEFQE